MKKVLALICFIALSLCGQAQNYINDIARIKPIAQSEVQRNICISRDRKYVAIASNSAIKIVDVQNFKIIKIVPIEFNNINTISFLSANERVLVVGNKNNETSAEIYLWPEKKLEKQVNPLGKGKFQPNRNSCISKNLLVCVDGRNVFIADCNTLDPIRNFKRTGEENSSFLPTISNDESLIAVQSFSFFGTRTYLEIYDTMGVLKYSTPTSEAFKDLIFKSSTEMGSIYKIDLSSKKSTMIGDYSDVPDIGGIIIDIKAGSAIYFGCPPKGDGWDFVVKLLFMNENRILELSSHNFQSWGLGSSDNGWGINPFVEMGDNKYLFQTSYQNFNCLVDTKKGELLGIMFHTDNKIAFVSSDGKFTGDNEAIANLEYKIKGRSNIKLASQIDQMYTPKLLYEVLNPDYIAETNNVELNRLIKLAPGIKIISPDSISNQKNNYVKVKYTVKDNGDGVKETKFFVNGKLLNDEFRGAQASGELSRDILLINGDNIIDAVAVSNSGYQSGPERIVAKYKGGEVTTNLYILGIGIDQYKNTKYNLNYAVTDAVSLADFIKANGSGIFSTIDIKVITDQVATKTNIIAELNRISQKINETDVFILFYAGHGAMSEGSAEVPKDYYLILTDVTQMFGNDALLSEKGISAMELREWCKKIKAQKQVIFLDACQSGEATEMFAMRGASEEKAIVQLAQSTGVFLISSTAAEQFATEYAVLKHGLFTYALLEGLGGKADGGTRDRKITIKEIEAYLNDIIPELTQKYKGSVQFPNTWSKGMDFPIVIASDK
ncbi:MAG: caspase family protein [Bacteroidia bacterium]|nr:caspase family protein [Bacteroidia bacterium]